MRSKSLSVFWSEIFFFSIFQCFFQIKNFWSQKDSGSLDDTQHQISTNSELAEHKKDTKAHHRITNSLSLAFRIGLSTGPELGSPHLFPRIFVVENDEKKSTICSGFEPTIGNLAAEIRRNWLGIRVFFEEEEDKISQCNEYLEQLWNKNRKV